MNRTYPIALFRLWRPLTVVALFLVVTFSQCARISMPQGGPKDSLPPRVVVTTPEFGTRDFKGKRIYIEFDEYVQLKEQQKEFFTSPFMDKKPVVSVRGRGIQIDIKDSLLANQTYALNFGRSVVDNNEGNPLTGLRYVFSTGKEIDSLVLSAYTVDAFKNDTVGNVFLLFYGQELDSVFDRRFMAVRDSLLKLDTLTRNDSLRLWSDSTIFNRRVRSVAKAFPNGIVLAENLKNQPYRIFALEDKNGNQTYEPGVDRVAFLDSTYNPQDLPPFDVWYDTTRHYLQAQPQLLFRLFMEPSARRQSLTTTARPIENKINLFFAAPNPVIEELTFEEIDSSRLQREFITAGRDSISVWINQVEDAPLPDTIRGRLIYQRQDSLLQYYRDTAKLVLGWRAPQVKKKPLKEGEKPVAEPNPFRVAVSSSGAVNPELPIRFTFDIPLEKLDLSGVVLERVESEKKSTQRKFTFTQDTAQLRQWEFKSAWKPEEKYRLVIPAGAFRNASLQSNDTLRSEFTIDSPEKYGILMLNLQGDTSSRIQYTIQLLSTQGTVLQERAHLGIGRHQFNFLPAGEFRIQIVEDRNGNGKWDTGSVVERRQPERVETFVNADGNEVLEARANWEIEYDVNLPELFAPITDERLRARVERTESLRLKRLALERQEALERKAKVKSTPNPNANNNNNMNDPNNGLNNGGNMRGNTGLSR